MTFVSVIAGLGNPGRTYQQTRHNAGADWLDHLAGSLGLSWKKQPKTFCHAAEWRVAGHKVWLVKPDSYMNESGRPLAAFLRFYHLEASQMVVAYDEITLPVGGFKISTSGSHAGHNGIKSLFEHVGSQFIRLRIGIGGKTHPAMDLAEHVLGKFPPEQWQAVQELFPTLNQVVQTLITQGPDRAMNQFNKKTIINNNGKQTQLPGSIHPEHS